MVLEAAALALSGCHVGLQEEAQPTLGVLRLPPLGAGPVLHQLGDFDKLSNRSKF